jgi:hypothetical protein
MQPPKHRIGFAKLIYLLIGALVLLVFGAFAQAQTETRATKVAKACASPAAALRGNIVACPDFFTPYIGASTDSTWPSE